MSPIERAERVASEYGVCLHEVEGVPDVYESDNLPNIHDCDTLAERLDALGCGTATSSGLSTWVTVDLSEAMREYRAEQYGAQDGSAHL